VASRVVDSDDVGSKAIRRILMAGVYLINSLPIIAIAPTLSFFGMGYGLKTNILIALFLVSLFSRSW